MSTYPEDEPVAGALSGRLLVVDDDEGNRDLLSRRLARWGHTVATADSGRRALEVVESEPFDVVLLDVMMPEMSGLDVLRVIRGMHSPSGLPVIMATARGQSEDVVEALRLGANDYVTKPLDFPVVLARVQTQLSLKRAVDQAARLERSLAERNRELEAANARLAAVNKRMARDLKAASRVQEAFLPRESPGLPGATCAWAYRPCEELAGDGLNAFPLDDRRSAVYVFDVCGHGVAAALLSVTLSRVLAPPGDPASVLTAVGGGESPAAVADHLNRMFPFEQADQYFTMFYGVLESQDGGGATFRFVSAGHPGLAHLPAAGGSRLFDGRGFPVGLANAPYLEQAVELAPGDRVVLYSDGVPEAMDPAGRAFATDRMLELLERERSGPVGRSVEALVGEVCRWCGAAGPRDDVSVLAFEIAGTGRREEVGLCAGS
jgi:sigma-B regulation protein RsbU (phosphoserine phosphatase)